MATIKSYTDLEQSKKLTEILPLESADMVLPFSHPKNDVYIPGYVVSRNYIEVYNEMIKLTAMQKEDICKLIQPCWSLAALLNVLPKYELNNFGNTIQLDVNLESLATEGDETLLDLVVNMIIHLHELKML